MASETDILTGKPTLADLLGQLKSDPQFARNIVHWKVLPALPGQYADFPVRVDQRLRSVLEKRGISRLYSHQAEAMEKIFSGKHMVIVTPPASGKTLCYNLPVLQSILNDPGTRALYLFPTKALSQDQLAELTDLVNAANADIKTYTFDGDTPQDARRAIRQAGHIVVTNPDMLHAGILPHHTKWIKLFENLKYVVIDELHNYRGIFGSHLGNVIRRFKRVCAFYGSKPQFVFCSATIGNPVELAEKILEDKVELVDNNGAPRGEKHFILYNPPVVNAQLGIRRSAVSEAQRLAQRFIGHDVQTIVFAPYRLTVEVLLTGLQEQLRKQGKPDDLVRGYRGGYLPLERREIERGLRDGSIKGVVATNALELGIDIGQLEVAILTGYPGNIASTLQQAGRAGRRQGISVAILVATSSPLDQFLMQKPEYLFSRSPETGNVDPNNLVILTSQVKCAAFELPFEEKEKFGLDATVRLLDHLVEHQVLHKTDGRYHWASEIYPANEVSLRSATPEDFVILNRSDNNRVIGEVDYASAPIFLFPEAIYLHGGEKYQVEELDWEGKKAYVKEAPVDYYTDAETKTELKVLRVANESERSGGQLAHGEVAVTTVPVLFKKIKFFTHENVGNGKISLPEQTMHTTAFWYVFPENVATITNIPKAQLGSSLRGLANLLQGLVPFWLLCDRRDIRVVPQVKAPFTEKPTLYIYDNVPGGVGFAERLFRIFPGVIQPCFDFLRACGCESGCPACVGPMLEAEQSGKAGVEKLLLFLKG